MLEQRQFKPYPKYRNSNVDWLGEVPTHWEVQRLKRVLHLSGERNGPEPVGDMLSVSGYRGIEPKDYEFEEQKRTIEELKDYRVVRVGQLVVNTMWLNYVGLGVSDIEGHVSPAYRCYYVSPKMTGRYLHHLVRSDQYVGRYCSLLYGIRPNSLQVSNENFDCIELLVPPFEEQQSIATFLDRESAGIDALIAKKQQLIELLKEKRTALITHAVTKGLDPMVPMKDSGIEWVGEIPTGWNMMRLKHACHLLRDGTHLPPPRTMHGVPLLSVRNIVDGCFRLLPDDSLISDEDFSDLSRSFQVMKNDVVLAIVGATIGKVAIVGEMPPFHIQRSLAVIRPDPQVLNYRYLAYLLESRGFQYALWSTVAFSAQPGIYLGSLADFPITIPGIEEQSRIAGVLVQETKKIEALVEKVLCAIQCLREFRAALISSAVTGQIDVRGEGA